MYIVVIQETHFNRTLHHIVSTHVAYLCNTLIFTPLHSFVFGFPGDREPSFRLCNIQMRSHILNTALENPIIQGHVQWSHLYKLNWWALWRQRKSHNTSLQRHTQSYWNLPIRPWIEPPHNTDYVIRSQETSPPWLQWTSSLQPLNTRGYF